MLAQQQVERLQPVVELSQVPPRVVKLPADLLLVEPVLAEWQVPLPAALPAAGWNSCCNRRPITRPKAMP